MRKAAHRDETDRIRRTAPIPSGQAHLEEIFSTVACGKGFLSSKGEGNMTRMLPLAASRDAALIQLVLVCASYEGRSRGPKDTAPRVTGRLDGRDREVWMQFEPCCPDGVLNVRRRAHGEKCAADRDSSQPTGHTSCPHMPFSSFDSPVSFDLGPPWIGYRKPIHCF